MKRTADGNRKGTVKPTILISQEVKEVISTFLGKNGAVEPRFPESAGHPASSHTVFEQSGLEATVKYFNNSSCRTIKQGKPCILQNYHISSYDKRVKRRKSEPNNGLRNDYLNQNMKESAAHVQNQPHESPNISQSLRSKKTPSVIQKPALTLQSPLDVLETKDLLHSVRPLSPVNVSYGMPWLHIAFPPVLQICEVRRPVVYQLLRIRKCSVRLTDLKDTHPMLFGTFETPVKESPVEEKPVQVEKQPSPVKTDPRSRYFQKQHPVERKPIQSKQLLSRSKTFYRNSKNQATKQSLKSFQMRLRKNRRVKGSYMEPSNTVKKDDHNSLQKFVKCDKKTDVFHSKSLDSLLGRDSLLEKRPKRNVKDLSPKKIDASAIKHAKKADIFNGKKQVSLLGKDSIYKERPKRTFNDIFLKHVDDGFEAMEDIVIESVWSLSEKTSPITRSNKVKKEIQQKTEEENLKPGIYDPSVVDMYIKSLQEKELLNHFLSLQKAICSQPGESVLSTVQRACFEIEMEKRMNAIHRLDKYKLKACGSNLKKQIENMKLEIRDISYSANDTDKTDLCEMDDRSSNSLDTSANHSEVTLTDGIINEGEKFESKIVLHDHCYSSPMPSDHHFPSISDVELQNAILHKTCFLGSLGVSRVARSCWLSGHAHTADVSSPIACVQQGCHHHSSDSEEAIQTILNHMTFAVDLTNNLKPATTSDDFSLMTLYEGLFLEDSGPLLQTIPKIPSYQPNIRANEYENTNLKVPVCQSFNHFCPKDWNLKSLAGYLSEEDIATYKSNLLKNDTRPKQPAKDCTKTASQQSDGFKPELSSGRSVCDGINGNENPEMANVSPAIELASLSSTINSTELYSLTRTRPSRQDDRCESTAGSNYHSSAHSAAEEHCTSWNYGHVEENISSAVIRDLSSVSDAITKEESYSSSIREDNRSITLPLESSLKETVVKVLEMATSAATKFPDVLSQQHQEYKELLRKNKLLKKKKLILAVVKRNKRVAETSDGNLISLDSMRRSEQRRHAAAKKCLCCEPEKPKALSCNKRTMNKKSYQKNNVLTQGEALSNPNGTNLTAYSHLGIVKDFWEGFKNEQDESTILGTSTATRMQFGATMYAQHEMDRQEIKGKIGETYGTQSSGDEVIGSQRKTKKKLVTIPVTPCYIANHALGELNQQEINSRVGTAPVAHTLGDAQDSKVVLIPVTQCFIANHTLEQLNKPEFQAKIGLTPVTHTVTNSISGTASDLPQELNKQVVITKYTHPDDTSVSSPAMNGKTVRVILLPDQTPSSVSSTENDRLADVDNAKDTKSAPLKSLLGKSLEIKPQIYINNRLYINSNSPHMKSIIKPESSSSFTQVGTRKIKVVHKASPEVLQNLTSSIPSASSKAVDDRLQPISDIVSNVSNAARSTYILIETPNSKSNVTDDNVPSSKDVSNSMNT